MKKIEARQDIKTSRLEIGALLGILFAAALFLFRIGSAPKLASPGEQYVVQQNFYIHNIINSPLNAPYKLLDFGLLHIQKNLFAARLPAAIIGLLSVAAFYIIVRRWHGRRNAMMATVLFLSSGWLLHVGRLGTDNIIWLAAPLALLLLGSWLHSAERSGLVCVLGALLVGITLLVPGGIWFAAAFIFLQRKAIAEHWADAERRELATAIVLLIFFAGVLLYAVIRTPDTWRGLIGLPAQLPTIAAILKQWGDSLAYLFVRGPGSPELWLAHAPVFDVFESALCVLGIYFYARHIRNSRAKGLFVYFIIGSLLVAFNGATAMSFIVGVAYLLIATGVTYLLHRWFGVFPRNPLARNFGLGLVWLAIFVSAAYHLLAYFVAWQHSPDTIAIFNQHLL